MTLKKRALAISLGTILAATPAFANLEVIFDEGAPKDQFSFKNVGTCAIAKADLILDLSSSQSGLIFDVTSKGAGVEVYQPLDIIQGEGSLAAIPQVKDGDNIVRFSVENLPQEGVLAFTIDVDDTLGGREITVSNSEIFGSKVSLVKADQTHEAMIGNDAKATLSGITC